MSIQPFAQSLLSDVRKRREERERNLRKQQERNELLGLVGGLAVKIGNEALANKTVNFLNQEPVWNANQTQKLARKNAASFYNIQSAVDASGGDARSWAAKNMMPEFQARAEEILADEGEDISVLGTQTKFIARINPNATIKEGQNINLAIDPTKLHYFNPETGLSIT